MKQPDFRHCAAIAVLLLAGCASQPKPQFASDPFAPGNPPPTAPAMTPVVEPAPAIPAAVSKPAKSDLLQPPTDMFVLGPGDQLDIETLGTTPYHAPATVGLDGKIYYSFLPGIDVWGMT